VVDGVPNELRPVEPCIALLARLHAAGTPQFYLSNMPAPYAAQLEAVHDFVGWFADGVFSSRVHLVKPEPAIFVVAAQRFGVPPPELLFFDDHRPNVDAARAAGWQAEHFVDATAAAAALHAHGLLGA
jgi:putative hydrolase of the HAD superfamily